MTTQNNAPIVSDKIRDLANAIRGDFKLEGKKIEVEKTAYEKTLPEGVDMKTVNKIKAHDADFVAAAALVVGEISNPAMKKDKDLDVVTAQVNMGHDRARFQYERKQATPDGKGGETPIFGHLVVGYTTAAGRDRTDLKAVRQSLSAAAAEAFGE